MKGTDLDVDKDPVVRLVQHLVALCVERELERDLGLPCWDLPCLGHFNVVANQLDRLQLVEETVFMTRFNLTLHSVFGKESASYLDRIVEGLKDADTLGAQLQVHQALHAQEDAVMLQRLLRHEHNDTGHCLLHTANMVVSDITDNTNKVYR